MHRWKIFTGVKSLIMPEEGMTFRED